MVITRNLREFASVGIWGLFAVSVANQAGHLQIIRYVCYITIAALLAFIIWNGARKKVRSVHSM